MKKFNVCVVKGDQMIKFSSLWPSMTEVKEIFKLIGPLSGELPDITVNLTPVQIDIGPKFTTTD